MTKESMPFIDNPHYVSFVDLESAARVQNDFLKFPTEEKSENATMHISTNPSNPGLRLRANLYYEDDLLEAKRWRDEKINKNIVNGSFTTIFELDDDAIKEDKIWRKATNDLR